MEEIERRSYTPFFNGLISDVVAIPLGGGRKLLMLSGVAAQNPDGKPFTTDIVSSDYETQLRHVWKRIEHILELEGGKIHDIVKIVTYVTDARRFPLPTGAVLREVFAGGPVPVSTGVVVTGLAYPEMLVEVDAMAVIG